MDKATYARLKRAYTIVNVAANSPGLTDAERAALFATVRSLSIVLWPSITW